MAAQPITVAIERHVDPGRITEATIWTQGGADLAGWQPGYTGARVSFAPARTPTSGTCSKASRTPTRCRPGRPRPSVTGGGSGEPAWWKQAVCVWLGLYPTNLAIRALITLLGPRALTLWLPLRLLITTVIVTPVMTCFVLAWVTRLLRSWLSKAPG